MGSQKASAEQGYSWIGGDFPLYYPMPAGPPPRVVMTLYDSAHYDLPRPTLSSNLSLASDYDQQLADESYAEWQHLGRISEGIGRAHLGLEQRMFAVKAYHNMHCMSRLAGALLDRSDPIANFHHVEHCLNYLRQEFLCEANEGLEEGSWVEGWGEEDWELLGFEGAPTGINGGVSRQDKDAFRQGKIRGELLCEDWEMVFQEVKGNYKSWKQWRAKYN